MRAEKPRRAWHPSRPHHKQPDKPLALKADLRIALEPWALVIALLWQELVLKASTTGGFWPQGVFILMFSVAFGLIARLLIGLVPNRAANKWCKVGVMGVAGVMFCVQYFLYRAFKLFYDLNTVLVGAGDAATGFADKIWALVLSPTGILHIVAFLAPAIAYAALFEGELMSEDAKDVFAARVRLARNAVMAELLGLALVFSMGTYGRTLTDRYSFQSAVPSFGLVTSLCKEVQTMAGGGTGVTFTTADPVATPSRATTPGATDANEEPVVYGKNELDIDFEALTASTSGTWADLDRYVASLAPSSQNTMTGRCKGYNLVFISCEALSAEAIRPDTTPTLYRMATKGIQFTDYYQFDSAGTTGGECGNLLGLLPTEGGSSVKITAGHNNYLTIGNALNRLGYDGWAFHNNTYTYYGRDKTHNNLGYNNGYMGYGNGMEQWVSWQWPQSDLEMVQGTFDNLYGSVDHEPFDVYYMSVSGHSGYAPGENAISRKNWDAVKDLPYSDPVKGYLACNIELDKALEWLIARLEEKGMADHTLIVMGADHFPYGLDDDGPLGSLPYTSELYGYDVLTSFQRDHNRLIMWTPSFEDEDPLVVDTPTSTIDILPTLLNLFGCEWDSRLLPGRDVFSDKAPLVVNLSYEWKSDLGTYYAGSGEFVPNEGAQIPEGYVEAISADAANRINYCRGVLTTDYYRHVFGEPQDVRQVHDAARAALPRHRPHEADESDQMTVALEK